MNRRSFLGLAALAAAGPSRLLAPPRWAVEVHAPVGLTAWAATGRRFASVKAAMAWAPLGSLLMVNPAHSEDLGALKEWNYTRTWGRRAA